MALTPVFAEDMKTYTDEDLDQYKKAYGNHMGETGKSYPQYQLDSASQSDLSNIELEIERTNEDINKLEKDKRSEMSWCWSLPSPGYYGDSIWESCTESVRNKYSQLIDPLITYKESLKKIHKQLKKKYEEQKSKTPVQ